MIKYVNTAFGYRELTFLSRVLITWDNYRFIDSVKILKILGWISAGVLIGRVWLNV